MTTDTKLRKGPEITSDAFTKESEYKELVKVEVDDQNQVFVTTRNTADVFMLGLEFAKAGNVDRGIVKANLIQKAENSEKRGIKADVTRRIVQHLIERGYQGPVIGGYP